MPQRFVAIWFRQLTTDWLIRRQPQLHDVPFVLAARQRGRMLVRAASIVAQNKGIHPGMVVADCRAILPSLQVFDDEPDRPEKLLHALAEWCLRYTPVVAVNLPDGLILDASGCPHLWGGERPYLKNIITRLKNYGYHVRAAMADTIGAAWAVCRYGQVRAIIEQGEQAEALLPLAPAALRLEPPILERLEKLGLYQIRSFITMPRSALRRRFGLSLLSRIDQALGQEKEPIEPIYPIQPYQERLPCLEPICTAVGIEIALKKLLEILCGRLIKEEKGIRKCVFTAYRLDGNVQQIEIGTTKASQNAAHLFKLFEIRIGSFEPELGFELFMLEALTVEDVFAVQDALWDVSGHHNETAIAELLDRLAGKVGIQTIHRYLPDEHYWPERSVKEAVSLHEKPLIAWNADLPRPVHLLPRPEPIEVAVPLPDYPPIHFKHKGKLHKVVKADGPERIGQEWWIEENLHRDYYCVEDENGCRYWLFRAGHYGEKQQQWFIHGYFA